MGMQNGRPVMMGQQGMGSSGYQTPQAQQMAQQSQFRVLPQQQIPPLPQGSYGAPPPRPFPPASVGTAGMTQAHVSHYYQLQEGAGRGSITPSEQSQLQQYINVLAKFFQGEVQSKRPIPPQAAQYFATAGRGQYQPQYPPQGGYSGGPQTRSSHPGQHPQQYQQQPPPPKPKPVIKGAPPLTSGTILARQLALASGGFGSAKKKPAKAPKKNYNSDSDDDGGDYDSAGSGDEYGSRETPAQIAKREGIAVEFFNDCTKEQLMELAGAFFVLPFPPPFHRRVT